MFQAPRFHSEQNPCQQRWQAFVLHSKSLGLAKKTCANHQSWLSPATRQTQESGTMTFTLTQGPPGCFNQIKTQIPIALATLGVSNSVDRYF
jgi:hypothetical protein